MHRDQSGRHGEKGGGHVLGLIRPIARVAPPLLPPHDWEFSSTDALAPSCGARTSPGARSGLTRMKLFPEGSCLGLLKCEKNWRHQRSLPSCVKVGAANPEFFQGTLAFPGGQPGL